MSRREKNERGLEREAVRERGRVRLEERERIGEERLKATEGLTGVCSGTPPTMGFQLLGRKEDGSPLFPALVGPQWTNQCCFNLI